MRTAPVSLLGHFLFLLQKHLSSGLLSSTEQLLFLVPSLILSSLFIHFSLHIFNCLPEVDNTAIIKMQRRK
ncbi:hypothetical protein I79_026209 [Cricetulus griseus]|uniref:Uncharacterized protein n=1 Tax=Cricetulus griseus TaxID=10029 RepID=G3IQA5_CRIGR|nr:hypothetical protein I79_026209 [Cricetulus griseus]